MYVLTRVAAVIGVVTITIVMSACQQAPTPQDTVEEPQVTSSYCARMVTNSGGLEDRSFNQSTWEGLKQIREDQGIDTQAIVSTSETDLAPNVVQAVESGCDLVVTVGWDLAEATKEQALSNPDTHFVIVDEQVEAENVKSMVFNTAEAAYLAGYLAAGASRSGVVGTFGGGQQPPVTLFMDGFVDGVGAYNEAHGTQVQALGWDKDTQIGVFTGDFEDVAKGKTTAQTLIDAGADVIMPVAAQVGEGAAAAALDENKLIIWVDNDGYETLSSEFRSIVLTSVLKNAGSAIQEIVTDDLEGTFANESFVGTLANGGVDIAPFHEQQSAVSAELEAEIENLRQKIISGEIVVESQSAPANVTK
ncbi:BMP family ABC transporter substrate-binding protein [Lysinibacter sp. HNR]|uniref:BMP family lipoprotein n=1 Tax=Lysinibacter sp. HNR TaxID=3031408 RepID=UPI002435DACE|nr:BMP family ABC transporter substrate-binding protein [Lysinibacter sp. HNR]WGD37036.1 BMP family ABC transporter substrate-binding protein [Lysinibacter sp. HNR]